MGPAKVSASFLVCQKVGVAYHIFCAFRQGGWRICLVGSSRSTSHTILSWLLILGQGILLRGAT